MVQVLLGKGAHFYVVSGDETLVFIILAYKDLQ